MTPIRDNQVLYANAIGASQNNTQPIQTLDFALIALSTILFTIQFLNLK